MTIEPTSFFGFIKPVLSLLQKVKDQLSLKLFLRKDKNKPYDEEAAKKIGFSVLGGTILSAIPFPTHRPKLNYLAIVRKENDDAPECCIHLLERVGGAYTQVWSSDSLSNRECPTFAAVDLDRDGFREIVFEEASFGSGGGVRCLYIYSIRKKQLYEITEHSNWQDASNPGTYPVINAGDDERLRNKIIEFAQSRGFLQGNKMPDFDNPTFAILRWHKENGDKRIGKVQIHWYEGKPVSLGSIVSQLETKEIHWIACFKGPLYAYSKLKQQYFIVYSPQWKYEWVHSMAYERNKLWFVCHGIPGLFAFELEKELLSKFCAYNGEALAEIEQVSLQNGILSVSTMHTPNIQLYDLSKLDKCRPFCRLNIPHLSSDCKHEDRSESYGQLKL